jgi:Trypsin-like peptidase domain
VSDVGLDRLGAATCDVFVGGVRKGSGTLVDGRHVLTARHVVGESGDVKVQFVGGSEDWRLTAERCEVGAGSADLDVSVLAVKRADRAALPAPAELWPWRRLPDRVKGYGFPLAEGRRPRGVWIDSTVSAGVRDERVQLDWEASGSFLGHSGGPIADERTGAMVGVLVEGAEEGHFDRLVPLSAVRRLWPALAMPWAFDGRSGREHFV